MCRFYVGTSTSISPLGVHRIKLNSGRPWCMLNGSEHNQVYNLDTPIQEGSSSCISKFDWIVEIINDNPLLVHLLESYLKKPRTQAHKINNTCHCNCCRSDSIIPPHQNNSTNTTMPTQNRKNKDGGKKSSPLFASTISSQGKAKTSKGSKFQPMDVKISNNVRHGATSTRASKSRTHEPKRTKDEEGATATAGTKTAPPASPVNKPGSSQKKRVQPNQTPEKSPAKASSINVKDNATKDKNAADNDAIKNLFGSVVDGEGEWKKPSKTVKQPVAEKDKSKREDKRDTGGVDEEEKETGIRMSKEFMAKWGINAGDEDSVSSGSMSEGEKERVKYFYFTKAEVDEKRRDPAWREKAGGAFVYLGETGPDKPVSTWESMRWANRVDWKNTAFMEQCAKEVAERLRMQGVDISDEDLTNKFGPPSQEEQDRAAYEEEQERLRGFSAGYQSPSEDEGSVNKSAPPEPPRKPTTNEARGNVEVEDVSMGESEDEGEGPNMNKPSRVSFGKDDFKPSSTSTANPSSKQTPPSSLRGSSNNSQTTSPPTVTGNSFSYDWIAQEKEEGAEYDTTSLSGGFASISVRPKKDEGGKKAIARSIHECLLLSDKCSVGLEFHPFNEKTASNFQVWDKAEDAPLGWLALSNHVFVQQLWTLEDRKKDDGDDDKSNKNNKNNNKNNKKNNNKQGKNNNKRWDIYFLVRIKFPPGTNFERRLQDLSIELSEKGIKLYSKRVQLPDTITPAGFVGCSIKLCEGGVESEISHALKAIEQRRVKNGELTYFWHDEPLPMYSAYLKGIKEEALSDEVKKANKLTGIYSDLQDSWKKSYVIECAPEDWVRLGSLVDELEDTLELQRILGPKAKVVQLKQGNKRSSEDAIIKRQKLTRMQVQYNAFTRTLNVPQISSLNMNVETVLREDWEPPEDSPENIPERTKFTNIRNELLAIRCRETGKQIIHAAVPIRIGSEAGETQLVTLCNGPEFDMACKLKREPAMWLWHWCYDYRGYDESTLDKLFKGFQLDAALLVKHSQFDRDTFTVKSNFNNTQDDEEYFAEMDREFPLVFEEEEEEDDDDGVVDIAEEARQTLLKSLNIENLEDIQSFKSGPSRREGYDEEKTEGNSTIHSQNPVRNATTNKSAALENARIRMQLFEAKQAKEKMEMEKSEIAKRNKQLESLLAQQQGSPHLSGSLAPDKPLPNKEGGTGGAGQG